MSFTSSLVPNTKQKKMVRPRSKLLSLSPNHRTAFLAHRMASTLQEEVIRRFDSWKEARAALPYVQPSAAPLQFHQPPAFDLEPAEITTLAASPPTPTSSSPNVFAAKAHLSSPPSIRLRTDQRNCPRSRAVSQHRFRPVRCPTLRAPRRRPRLPRPRHRRSLTSSATSPPPRQLRLALSPAPHSNNLPHAFMPPSALPGVDPTHKADSHFAA